VCRAIVVSAIAAFREAKGEVPPTGSGKRRVARGGAGPMPLALHPDVVSHKALAAGFRWENGQVFTGG